MQNLWRYIILAICSVAIYSFRYKIVNLVLGQPEIRRSFIHLSMRIPFIRDRFVHRAFQ
ncbi:hypothetical protein [Metabacillus fastidiosus]|uniref:hypothetical protein n=1 Tax=Metabacillus fastidiosus TaxID=1458 RepID=UPI002DBC9C48|nr:hypothetical protein [Metabacillus fastidiosus]MEC2076565.1 hypothetical protein [Metabacillus fastidiosus]MED4530713.1 hypothetical protein [Metabacillus fastidiosus]